MKKKFLFFFLLVACCPSLVNPSPILAHDATLTYTSLSITDKTINVALTTPYKNIQNIYPEKNKAIDEMKLDFFTKPFKKGFIITNDGEKCDPSLTNAQTIPDIKEVAYQFEFRCKKAFNKLHFSYNLFYNVSKTHENIATFYIDDFEDQIIFSKDLTSYDLFVKDIQGKISIFHSLWNSLHFLTLGIQHIFTGYDHILFLVALVLITKGFPTILKIVTGFTIGHSITLILSSLSVISLSPKITESIIALSIIYVAVENIIYLHKNKTIKSSSLRGVEPIQQRATKQSHHRLRFPRLDRERSLTGSLQSLAMTFKHRWFTAFSFGLIHGFGFSYVLQELGLPKNDRIISLLSFNGGVEIGQIAIIALILPILWYIGKQSWKQKALILTSATIGMLGTYWFIVRIFS